MSETNQQTLSELVSRLISGDYEFTYFQSLMDGELARGILVYWEEKEVCHVFHNRNTGNYVIKSCNSNFQHVLNTANEIIRSINLLICLL